MTIMIWGVMAQHGKTFLPPGLCELALSILRAQRHSLAPSSARPLFLSAMPQATLNSISKTTPLKSANQPIPPPSRSSAPPRSQATCSPRATTSTTLVPTPNHGMKHLSPAPSAPAPLKLVKDSAHPASQYLPQAC